MPSLCRLFDFSNSSTIAIHSDIKDDDRDSNFILNSEKINNLKEYWVFNTYMTVSKEENLKTFNEFLVKYFFFVEDYIVLYIVLMLVLKHT